MFDKKKGGSSHDTVHEAPPLHIRLHRCYGLYLTGIWIVRNEGWQSFCRKTLDRLKRTLKIHPADPYRAMILRNRPDTKVLERQKREARSLKYRPKISIVTSLWKRDEDRLPLAIDSVVNQTYDHWELCLASGASSMPDNKGLLQEHSRKDPRVKVKHLEQDEGAAGNLNRALSMASGEFIAFLDPNDELTPFALYEVVKLLNDNPAADFIYSDEALMDESGEPFYALHRPDFSMDYFLSHPYISHLVVVRGNLIREASGFREELAASYDYDLFLRVISRAPTIVHLPHILYKRRQNDIHSKTSSNSKTAEINKAIIARFIENKGIQGDVYISVHPNCFRVKRHIHSTHSISIIIPTRDKIEYLSKCIDSIEAKTFYRNYEVIIINNLSNKMETEEYLYHLLRRYTHYRVSKFSEKFNFSRIINYGVRISKGDHLLFLNNDTEIISGEWLEALLEHSQREEVACVGAKLLYPDNRIQHAGVIIGGLGTAEHIHRFSDAHDIGYMGQLISIRNYSAVTAACMMVKRKVFYELTGFDERFKVAFGDVDFCLRSIEKGYQNIYTPYATLYHHESLTRGRSLGFDPHPEDSSRFIKRWNEFINNGDPQYNRNLPLYEHDITPYVELRRRGRTRLN